jgi:hypothetical protein
MNSLFNTRKKNKTKMQAFELFIEISHSSLSLALKDKIFNFCLPVS